MPVPVVALATWLADAMVIVGTALGVGALGFGDHTVRLIPFALVCYTGVARVAGAYDLDALFYLKHCWPRVLNAWLCTAGSIAALCVGLGNAASVPFAAILALAVGGMTGLASARIAIVRLIAWARRGGAFNDRTVIVGTGPQALDLVAYMTGHHELAMSLIGFVDDGPASDARAAAMPLPYLGGVAELVDAIRAGAVDKVFVALPWADEARLHAVVAALSATPVEIRLAPDRAGFAFAQRRVTSLAGLWVITLLERPLTATQLLLKATEDRLLAVLVLILLAPLMLMVALLIKLTSPGPVLFRQSREGFNCSSFEILKFRTMYLPAGDADAAVVQACRHDPRVTRLGAILRRTSIDELPQLFNVLTGHMSLVGPRPHAASTRAGGRLFADIAATYAARHKVKPGLTGWAQICGWRGETTTEEKLIRRLEHDMYYVEHWSIWFDLYILARTGVTVLLQRGAY